MADNKAEDRPQERQSGLRRSVDMGDLKGELGKRSGDTDANLRRALESVDFGDLKSELGKGKAK